MRLIWDINLQDERLPACFREAFPKLSRLPFYYCFNCPQATTYQVLTENAVVCLDPAGQDGGDETPYAFDADVPEELPRSPIHLEELPRAIDDIINKETETGFDSLNSAEREQLSTFLSKKVDSPWGLVFSQIGGLPVLVQGHWDIRCPNGDCPASDWDKGQNLEMKELAVFEQDSAHGFKWVYAPVAYHVCWCCGTIQGNFRCS